MTTIDTLIDRNKHGPRSVLYVGGYLLSCVPNQPVLPVRPRRLAAWNRALLVVDSNAARDRPDRGKALGPGWRPGPGQGALTLPEIKVGECVQ